MRCPNCKHAWSRPKKAKPALPYTESAPGEVFPQRCGKCKSPMGAGEPVMAASDFPVAFCMDCHREAGSPGSTRWGGSKLVPAVVAGVPAMAVVA